MCIFCFCFFPQKFFKTFILTRQAIVHAPMSLFTYTAGQVVLNSLHYKQYHCRFSVQTVNRLDRDHHRHKAIFSYKILVTDNCIGSTVVSQVTPTY